jgi:hypothetical protein
MASKNGRTGDAKPGDGKSGSPLGPSSGQGPKPTRGNNFTQAPEGTVGDSRGRGTNLIADPGGGNKATSPAGNNFTRNPAGSMATTPTQKTGTTASPASIRSGPSGALPYSTPANTRTPIDEPSKRSAMKNMRSSK